MRIVFPRIGSGSAGTRAWWSVDDYANRDYKYWSIEPRVKVLVFGFRKSATDRDVAKAFYLSVLNDVEENWKDIDESIFPLQRPAIFDVNPVAARACFFLALFSLEIQAIPNLFPAELAETLRAWSLEHLRRLPGGELMLDEVLACGDAYRRIPPSAENPSGGIAAHLTYRWHGLADSLTNMQLSGLLISLSGRWNRIKKSVDIQRTALPPNWNGQGFSPRPKYALDRLVEELLGESAISAADSSPQKGKTPS